MKRIVVLLVIVFLFTGSAWGKEEVLYSQRRLGKERDYTTTRGDSIVSNSPVFETGARLDARSAEKEVLENEDVLLTGRSTAIYIFKGIPRGVLSFSLDIHYKLIQSDPAIVTPLMVGILRPREKMNGEPKYTNLQLDPTQTRWSFEDLDGSTHIKNGTIEIHISALNATADISYLELLCFGHRPRIERIKHYSPPPRIHQWTSHNISYYCDYPGPYVHHTRHIHPRYDVYVGWWGGIEFIACWNRVKVLFVDYPVYVSHHRFRRIRYEPSCIDRYRRVHGVDVVAHVTTLPPWREVHTGVFLAERRRDGSPRGVAVSTKTRRDKASIDPGNDPVRSSVVRENSERDERENFSPSSRSGEVRTKTGKTRDPNRNRNRNRNRDQKPGTWTITTNPEVAEDSAESQNRTEPQTESEPRRDRRRDRSRLAESQNERPSIWDVGESAAETVDKAIAWADNQVSTTRTFRSNSKVRKDTDIRPDVRSRSDTRSRSDGGPSAAPPRTRSSSSGPVREETRTSKSKDRTSTRTPSTVRSGSTRSSSSRSSGTRVSSVPTRVKTDDERKRVTSSSSSSSTKRRKVRSR